MMLYFAKDGSYGDASDLTILNTEHWSEEDFALVEEASDTARWYVAIETAVESSRKRMIAALGGSSEDAS